MPPQKQRVSGKADTVLVWQRPLPTGGTLTAEQKDTLFEKFQCQLGVDLDVDHDVDLDVDLDVDPQTGQPPRRVNLPDRSASQTGQPCRQVSLPDGQPPNRCRTVGTLGLANCKTANDGSRFLRLSSEMPDADKKEMYQAWHMAMKIVGGEK